MMCRSTAIGWSSGWSTPDIPFGTQPGLHGDNRAYYLKVNDSSGPGLRDLAGNEVSVPHQNHGLQTTRWVPLEKRDSLSASVLPRDQH